MQLETSLALTPNKVGRIVLNPPLPVRRPPDMHRGSPERSRPTTRFMCLPLFFFLLMSALLGVTAAEAPQGPASAARPFVVGLSPYLDKSVKDDVYRSIVRLLVADLPLNSTLAVYDAFDLKTITCVTLPDARVFNSAKTRANQFAPAIHQIKQFLAQEHPRGTNSRLNFEAAIRLPQFLDFLAENLGKCEPAVLLIGSPLYQDAKEPAFSMVDGYFPSDGHLRASREQSVFGLASSPLSPGERAGVRASQDGPASGLSVHWAYFGDPWINELHREKVTRFWALYLEARSDRLMTFTSDLQSALRSFNQASTQESVFAKRWTPEKDSKIEMLRVSRNVQIADWLTRDTLPEAAPAPPTRMSGPMKIGIRWKPNIDLDLYATPRPGAETLFFEHVRSSEGYYFKDHRSSPGREYEFIEFELPVDIREVEAFVNFYKGRCPDGPRGEVRIEFDGRIYSGQFAIVAEEGNLGRPGTSQQEYWTRIPVQSLMGIRSTARR